jgi:hypothetical protein
MKNQGREQHQGSYRGPHANASGFSEADAAVDVTADTGLADSKLWRWTGRGSAGVENKGFRYVGIAAVHCHAANPYSSR